MLANPVCVNNTCMKTYVSILPAKRQAQREAAAQTAAHRATKSEQQRPEPAPIGHQGLPWEMPCDQHRGSP